MSSQEVYAANPSEDGITDAPPKSMLYTRTGDLGESSLYNGERRSKADAVFHAMGNVDTLNSSIGLAAEFCNDKRLEFLKREIAEIQCNLIDIGSNLATPRDRSTPEQIERTNFDVHGHRLKELEHWIDSIDCQLPPLTVFILPSGGKTAATLHQARSICRQAERSIIPLVEQGSADLTTLAYINRLSDYLFAAARFAAKVASAEETLYVKTRDPSTSRSHVPMKRRLDSSQGGDQLTLNKLVTLQEVGAAALVVAGVFLVWRTLIRPSLG